MKVIVSFEIALKVTTGRWNHGAEILLYYHLFIDKHAQCLCHIEKTAGMLIIFANQISA